MNKFVPAFVEITPRVVPEFESLVDSGISLTIRLTSDDGVMLIRFDDHLIYRKLDEGDALKMLDEMATSSSLGKTFYLVEKSEFLEWMERQTFGVKRAADFNHWVVAAANDWIDIVSKGKPRISKEK